MSDILKGSIAEDALSMTLCRTLVFAVAAALLLALPACLFHTRTVTVTKSTAPLLNATQQELIDRINSDAAKVKTLNATVDIDTSVGGEKKGKVTDYQQISGYVLVRKPSMLRMIGLFPLVRNKAFDMVSNGTEFKLSIPVKSKFYVGHNDIMQTGTNSLENMRPQYIYDALLLQPIDAETDVAVLESSSETVVDAKTKQMVEQPTYIIDVIKKSSRNSWRLARKVVFDRIDLIPDTQIFYDESGNITTEARYQAYKDFDGIRFPSVIQIKRPQEEYAIQLTISKLTPNEPLSDEQFALEAPAGYQVVNLDQQSPAAANGSVPSTTSTTPPKL